MMAELKQNMPDGMDYSIVYDPTQFVRASIEAVVHTLLEAVALVVLVVHPVPADLAGVDHPADRGAGFHHRHLRGDACLRLLHQRADAVRTGAAPSASWSTTPSWWSRTSSATSSRACRRSDAAYQRDAGSVPGPIIAIALVLIAVFVPLAFISGLTGQFYKQFALTIAISTVISAFNSLTLSPALGGVAAEIP